MEALSYEGPEKFIFISYAHKDSDRVLRIIEKLVENGYRIWYDDGIAPGSEWPEDIAQHLDSCAVFMAFVSNNSIASDNCRREVTFALNRRKPFLGILLEPTQMSLGMEMQLSAHQCILRHNFRRESDFIQKIFSCPDLECCKIQPEPEPVPEPVAVPAPVAVPQPEPEPVAAPVTEAEAVPVPVPKAKPVKKPKEKAPRQPRSGKKKRLPMILGGAAALIALLILLFAVILQVRVSDGKKVGRNETYITLQETAITKSTVRQLNKLKRLKTLNIRDCTVEDNALDGLKCEKLESFTLQNTQVDDYAFLEQYSGLRNLYLENCGFTDGKLSFAAFEKLYKISLNDNTAFTDLSVLPMQAVETLLVNRTGVTDLTPLAQAKKLRELEAEGNAIDSVDALAALENLSRLDLSDCRLTGVTQPFLSLSMRSIDLSDNQLSDLSGFCNFTVVREARLGNNQLTDVSWLEKNTAELKTVDLANNPLDMEDLRFLADCPNMSELYVSGIPVDDLSFAAGMTELQILGAAQCGLTKLPDLSGLVQLRKLYLQGNQLTELTGLPPVGAVSGITVLNLADNRLSDLSELPDGQYYYLMLQGNPVVFAPGCWDGLQGDQAFVEYHESMLTCGGTREYWRIYIQDVPADQQLKIKDAFSSRAVFVDRAGMLEALKEAGLA